MPSNNMQSYILIIDDQMAIRQFMDMLLTDEGYEVRTANNGLAGLELATTSKPALILLDWQMPEMNGATFIETYQANMSDPAPIIVMTAKGSEAELSFHDKVSGFMHKPFDLDDLLSSVKRILA